MRQKQNNRADDADEERAADLFAKQRGVPYRRNMSARRKRRNKKISSFRYWLECDGAHGTKFLKKPNDSNLTKPLKRQSNRTARRKKDVPNGRQCHKFFQYEYKLL